MTLSLFASRIDEVKVPLQTTAQQFVDALDGIQGCLQSALEWKEQMQIIARSSNEQKASITDMEANLEQIRHREIELNERVQLSVTELGAMSSEHVRVRTDIHEAMVESITLQAQHDRAREALLGQTVLMHDGLLDMAGSAERLVEADGGKPLMPDWLRNEKKKKKVRPCPTGFATSVPNSSGG